MRESIAKSVSTDHPRGAHDDKALLTRGPGVTHGNSHWVGGRF